MADNETGAPPRALIVVATVLAVALAVGVGLFALLAPGEEEPADPATGPLALVPVPAPEAGSDACDTLVGAAPGALTSSGETLPRRELAEPAPRATTAWGAGGSAGAVVLRCGLDRPPELTRTANLRVINEVQWLHVPGEGAASWYVVDREVYAALTVPDDAGTGPLQEISDVVDRTLPQVPLRFD
ncbi:DUF3515 domain-containing protein [Amycolatopsis cihanbeyliensis]|uniref:Uncharacterized protein DUF3515 n=1 Tax=Amycolatopsis cihanbeyliensis TaxID=1128664 RepID=A0A542DH42_AMYCI|nr:DUF3515 domain-containing protein [Amycolatopsis cihanbeyliensis]TQJ02387.1 uncharacterized protein DUF3515 [Amycolatopsis cihanbeyliensis]